MLYSNKDLRKLIIPLIIEQILQIAVGMADVIMISVVGEAAVSGVSLVDTVNILVINIFAALATGGTVVVGHYLGEKRKDSACASAWQLILFSTVFSIGVTALFIGAHNWILTTVFGQIGPEVMKNAKTYLIITALSICPLALYNSCAALFRAMNLSKVTMWISLLINVIHLIGNAICIFGLHWGVAGAAVPTTISRTIGAIVIFVMLFNRKRDIHLCGQVTWKPNLHILKKLLYIGIPNGMENSMFQLGKILLLSLISTFGTSAIAANAVANTIAALNVLPGIAISYALLAVSAVCLGAGEVEQARYYTKKLLKISTLGIAAISVLIIVFAPQIVSIYNLGPETTKITLQLFYFHGIMSALIWSPSFVLPNTLRAAGDVVWSMVLAIISMWVFRIVAAYIISYLFDGGVLGVWIAMTIDWGFRSVCYTIRYKGHRWETRMKEKPPKQKALA